MARQASSLVHRRVGVQAGRKPLSAAELRGAQGGALARGVLDPDMRIGVGDPNLRTVGDPQIKTVVDPNIRL